MIPRYRRASRGASAVALLAVMTAFALNGCAISQTPPVKSESVASVVETGTPFRSNVGIGAAVRPWYERLPSIPLATALSKVGGIVSLPDTTVVGTMTHVSLAPETRSLDPAPELLVLYSSGVQLFVNYGARDLQEAADMPAPFTDGRKTVGDLRQVDGAPVLVMQPGIQNGSHSSGNTVPAQLIWNAGGLSYYLTSSNENQSTDHLIAIMQTMRSATR